MIQNGVLPELIRVWHIPGLPGYGPTLSSLLGIVYFRPPMVNVMVALRPLIWEHGIP